MKNVPFKRFLVNRNGGMWGSEPGSDEFDVLCIRVADFDYENLKTKASASTVRSITEKQLQKNQLHDGDILLEKSGGGEKTPVGRAVYYSGNDDAICSNFIERLTVNQQTLNPKFACYILSAAYSQRKNLDCIKQTTGIQNLSVDDYLSSVTIPLFDIETQKRITKWLDKQLSKVAQVITAKQAQLQKLSTYRQSLITRAVTKGLDHNVEMKDSGVEWIGSIPREWKTSKISFVSDVTLGKMLCPRQTDSEQTLETYLCAGSISWDGVKDYIKEMWFSSKEKSELLLIAGDVLVVEGGAGFGMTTLYKGEHSPCYFQNSIIRVRGHHNVMTSDFINYWMRFTYTAYLKKVCNEATFSHYTKEKVSETPILVPPLNEQKKIADFCKLVDERVKTICAGIENQISKLNEYRSSLISAAVTGQLAIDEEASA